MNIRSLLLGSIASLSVAPSVSAVNGVVALEPEPVEYVHICDSYGKGYFYIPGAETCMQLGGMVRTQASSYNPYAPVEPSGTTWLTRSELYINATTDTEFGPLKTTTTLRFDYTDDSNTMGADLPVAHISLGGFLIGRAGSQYNDWIGYAGNVINPDVIGNGPIKLNQLSYFYDGGNGIFGVVSIEDSLSTNLNPNSADHYAPDPVVGLGYKAGPWSLRVVGGYDSVVEEGAIKARVDADFGLLGAFLMGAWNTDGSKINKFANGDVTGSTGDWALWTGSTVKINDRLSWNTQFAYADNKTFQAASNVEWFVTRDLKIEPEVSYVNYDRINVDSWAGALRVQRSF
ncbi:porin [Rhizobium mayense]|uniref:Porin n=1 Tax=Rhizobium mayense TaxID=1312184 RepID=A0ABT7K4N7_9HYPH|nr:porin [Rhizobium mayense]MDL2402935.1 porin [Rhizobium mayense]